MDRYFVEGNRQEPTVELDKEKGIFRFTGRSIISNPVEFYSPIVSWIREYCNSPNEETKVYLEMDYFNSSSFKALIDIFKEFKPLANKGLHVTWRTYEEDDIVDEARKIMEITGIEIHFEYVH